MFIGIVKTSKSNNNCNQRSNQQIHPKQLDCELIVISIVFLYIYILLKVQPITLVQLWYLGQLLQPHDRVQTQRAGAQGVGDTSELSQVREGKKEYP